MTPQNGRRRYESARRSAQAEQTRTAIAAAARRLFLERGWSATTVRDVASEAGVSVPTVYAAYGNKAGLTRAVADAADLAADPQRLLDELENRAATPASQVAAMAGFDRRLYERAGDVITAVREAGRVEPDLATAYDEARKRGDETRMQTFSSWPDGTLRDGVDLASAVDIYAAICNIDVFSTLTGERRWAPDRVEAWWSDVLARALLATAA